MALHRDIFWIGRQWAVTGAGLQAVDQRLKGAFDVDRSKVWNDGVLESLRNQTWFNAADFDKALNLARARFPAEPQDEPSPVEPARSASPEASGVSRPPAVSLELGIRGQLARFLPQWRIRH